jgi:hypothetical protein
MTFQAGTTGAIRTALVTTHDAIVEELNGIKAPSDHAMYLTALGQWCLAEAVLTNEGEPAHAGTHA